MDQFRANFKTIPDLGAAMIALRSPTTCSTERPRSQTSESSDVRTGNQARPARSLFERLALKTVILLILLIVPDLIRSERADFDAQQNNYHTTAGRHIERDETHPGPDPVGLARLERASIAADAPEQPDGHNNALETEEEATGFAGARARHSAPEEAGAAAADELPLGADRNQLPGLSKLHIVRLFAPEVVRNGTQNVTLDCMFKFDKKLDQRLTIKWFYEDELEPIYQWIPELNKRVFSDRYEQFLDKSYEVSEDADFMLQAYRWMLSGGTSGNQPADAALTSAGQQQVASERAQLEASRRTLASRLNKLAKLGGQHSRHLLDSLRAALNMDQPDFSRFRALRLLRPTTQLSGRFTCSVSSLDGDDLRSTRLLVYEAAKNFQFNVSRVAGQPQYNLTCRAEQVFPQPTLALFRYRAGPLEPQQQHFERQQQPVAHRPKLAATLLRQEPIAGTQTQLLVRPVARQHAAKPETDSDLAMAEPNDITMRQHKPSGESGGAINQQALVYEISTWALVDEASLSSNVVSQFECLLSIEGTGYEQRHSLALQRGWHVNSASGVLRSTLVGLFSALASLLCLILALVSSVLIFRLLRRHAKNRVHEQKSNGSSPTTEEEPIGTFATGHARKQVLESPPPPPALTQPRPSAGRQQQFGQQQEQSDDQSDGVYRVPFGTRFIIGPGSRSAKNYGPPVGGSFAANGGNNGGTADNGPPQTPFEPSNGNNIGNNKPLYC